MIPTQFDYAAPESLELAVQLLREHQGSQILAGGHSLLTAMKLGSVSPSLLVDLRKITAFNSINFLSKTNGGLRIGSMTTYAQVATDPEIKENYCALAEATNSIGDAQIRNWGRVGDIFAYRDLACDLPAVTLALEATFHTTGSGGTCVIPASKFIVAAFENSLEPGEIVTAIDFPPYVTGTGSAYENLKHPASGYTICGIAVLVTLSSNGTVGPCRVAVTGATAHAIRLVEVETALMDKAPTAENIADAAKRATESLRTSELARKGVPFLSDFYASGDYRAHMASVLTNRALTRATARAGLGA